MDNISPAKKDTDLQLNSDMVLELPAMIKRMARPLLGNFGKKNDFSKISHNDFSKISHNEDLQNKKQKGSSNIYSFTGGLLNLAVKFDKEKSGVPTKPKRTTSHMSQQLNKHKSQRPQPFQAGKNKLPSIFAKVALSKK